MRRKLLLTAAIVAGLALIALATLPWWLGLALRLGGGHYGLTFGEYRKVGYTRFALDRVEYAKQPVVVTASTIELDTPLLWLLNNKSSVKVGKWGVEISPPTAPKDPKKVTPSGWVPLRHLLDKIFDGLDRWLPSTTLESGFVAWPGSRIEFGEATWVRDQLAVTNANWRQLSAAVVVQRDSDKKRLRVTAKDLTASNSEVATDRWAVRSDSGFWDAKFVSEGATITADAAWQTQPLQLTAAFAPTGWLPKDARVEAKNWSLPGSRLKLGKFYTTVAGNAVVSWKNAALALEVHAAGMPTEGLDAPPLQVDLVGSGALDRLSVDRLDIQMPGVNGHLGEPVAIGKDGKLLSGKSRFEITADLAKQPWFNGRGQVYGTIDVTPRDDGIPLLEAALKTNDSVIQNWVLKSGSVAARVQWPRIEIATAAVELKDGDRLEFGGVWENDTRTLTDGRASGRISRATVAAWLPPTSGFALLEVDAKAAGVWPAIKHEGRAHAVDFVVPPLKPLALDATWHGTGADVETVTADVSANAGVTKLRVSGAFSPGAVRVDELTLKQKDAEQLRLAAPANVRWKPLWQIDPFALRGPAGELAAELAWGEQGKIKLNARNIASSSWADIFALKGPPWTVASLDLEGHWDNGPLIFTSSAAAWVELSANHRADLSLAASGGGAGVKLEMLRALMDKQPVVNASGQLPVAFWPGKAPHMRIDEDASLALNATTEPNALFWDQLTALTGLTLTDPSVMLKVSGTMKKPTGEGTIRITKIAPNGEGWAKQVPEIDGLNARLTGDRSGVALETLTAKISGQAVSASGRLPVKEWALLCEDPFAVVEASGEARIQIPDADVAALAKYAPAYLAPAGKLSIDIALQRGGQLKGTILLKDAATRPLGPLGILQSINAEIALDGRKVEFKRLQATTGGQPVTLTGTVELPSAREPKFDLALRGEKLPFVRQTGLLVRGDLDLRVVTNAEGATRITGKTILRDSLFLMDVRSLIPVGGSRSSATKRPPYFAVTVPPFSAWGLDVEVVGDRFLRLRTPVFTGLASTRFKLLGTLGEPRAIGEAVINQGQVLLPFATFSIRQGSVRLTEADPFEPRLSVIGTARRYGYDLRMEVTGTATKPQLLFTSTPSLESDQVLLMVMAGEAPQNETNYSGGERAARLGAFLGQSLLTQLGSDQSKAERLTITTGERVSRQGRETYGVEYELNPRWSLVGEYDEFDEYNLGVKWRVLKQKKPDDAALPAPKTDEPKAADPKAEANVKTGEGASVKTTDDPNK